MIIINRSVTLVDIDPDIIKVAEENARNVGMSHKCQFILCDVNNLPISFFKKFDFVFTNPPFGVRGKKEADVNFLKKAVNVRFLFI
jgi:predicted RNA methylase